MIDESFEFIPGAVAFVVDTIVYGRSQAEHNQALRKGLSECKRDKSQIQQR